MKKSAKELKHLKPHPLAQKFPPRCSAGRAELKESLEAIGQKQPILVIDNKFIVNGNERFEILTELDKEVWIEPYRGARDDSSIMATILALNDGKGLSASQRAFLVMEAQPFLKNVTVEKAAKMYGISRAQVFAAQHLQKLSKRMAHRVRCGELKLWAAMKQVKHETAVKEIATLKDEAAISLKDCTLQHGDNLELMRSMQAGSVDCIFADPPYNQGWKYREDPTGDLMPEKDYLSLCSKWMSECARLLTDDGSLFVLINDAWTDQFGVLLRGTGLKRRSTIVWWESFANYRSAENAPTCVARYIHYYTKSDKPFFNNVELRDASDREKKYNDKRQSGIGKVPNNVWEISRNAGSFGSRAAGQGPGDAPQVPIEVPERCILLATRPGDLVLDPFNGWGMTGIAALLNSRRYIGIDRDKAGLDKSRKWISHEFNRLTGGKR